MFLRCKPDVTKPKQMDSGFRAITSLFIVKRNDVVLAYPIITPCNLDP